MVKDGLIRHQTEIQVRGHTCIDGFLICLQVLNDTRNTWLVHQFATAKLPGISHPPTFASVGHRMNL